VAPSYLRWSHSIWALKLRACVRLAELNSRQPDNIFALHVKLKK
jgi:hypothetical protein